MNLYEFNQKLISQFTPLTEEEVINKAHIFNNLFAKTANKHYMLLCKEYSYYTIFEEEKIIFNNKFAETVLEIIISLGDIYSIEEIEAEEDNNAIEIWIQPFNKPKETYEPFVFYLFPYDAGVVKFG